MKEFVEIEDRIAAAFKAGDAAGIAAEYTEDAVLMGPGRPALVGRDAIEAHYTNLLTHIDLELSNTIEESEVAGDLAFIRGIHHSKITPKKGGPPYESSGKYLVIVKRQADGSWKFSRDAFNNDEMPKITWRHVVGGLLGGLFGKRG